MVSPVGSSLRPLRTMDWLPSEQGGADLFSKARGSFCEHLELRAYKTGPHYACSSSITQAGSIAGHRPGAMVRVPAGVFAGPK